MARRSPPLMLSIELVAPAEGGKSDSCLGGTRQVRCADRFDEFADCVFRQLPRQIGASVMMPTSSRAAQCRSTVQVGLITSAEIHCASDATVPGVRPKPPADRTKDRIAALPTMCTVDPRGNW